ncbi:MAG: molybdopterin-dependent oxidoreductase [Candidatus Omnitrophica bacterium]|nr:molybdopterin-dependent oxidoreductase [Candidatus Omnitrophota bacterium]
MAETSLARASATAQAAAAPKQVTLTVDGKIVTVPEGTTVLQACEQARSPVPFYCYHPGLSIAGNCRICLVEIEKTPKLQISCYTPVAEGMAVKTASDKALKGRQDVLEFLLANHPLDCPVCDQAGECWLQDYYMEYGLYDPKFDEEKVKKSKKASPIGPHVMLDAERCILCSRCVRFCDEVTKTGEFGIFNRGDHSEIGVFPGKDLKNNYSGCTVDICPVGALTDRDFRFKCRVWYLGQTNSVCPGCSTGCNIEIHDNRQRAARPHVAGGKRVMRLKPRFNPDVNKWWMCDVGRYAYHAIDDGRLEQVQVRTDNGAAPGTWDDALGHVAQTLAQFKQQDRLARVGVILSTWLTNEDLYVAKRLFGELGVRKLTVQGPKPADGDGFLLKADHSPNTAGARALGLSFDAIALVEQAARGEISILYVFGHDLAELVGEQAAAGALQRLERLIFQGTHPNQTSRSAHVVLPSAVYAEKDGTFTNDHGRVQRIAQAVEPLGESRLDWRILLELGQRLGVALEFADARAIFKEMASREPAFRGLSYETIGDQGALLAEPSTK